MSVIGQSLDWLRTRLYGLLRMWGGPPPHSSDVSCINRRRRFSNVALPVRPRFFSTAELDEDVAEVVERLVVVRIERDGALPVRECGVVVMTPGGNHPETVMGARTARADLQR